MGREKAENEQRKSALKEVRSPGRTKEKKYWGRRRLACGQFGTNCLYKQCLSGVRRRPRLLKEIYNPYSIYKSYNNYINYNNYSNYSIYSHYSHLKKNIINKLTQQTL